MWRSRKQMAWGNSPAGRKAMGSAKVEEFNDASKGRKLPEKAKHSAAPKPKVRPHRLGEGKRRR